MFSRRNLTLVIGTLILSLAVVIGAMPADPELGLAARDGNARIVQVDTVERTPSSREVRLPGVTRSAERAALAFAVPARLASRPVEVGDRVRAGQVLARLDDSEYELANRSAEAVLAELDVRLEQARRDEARVAQLAGAKAATAEELEKTQAGTATLAAARDAAAARVEDTRRLLTEATLHAPFDATVTRVLLEPGEWASPGKTVLELAGSGTVEVQVEVPEAMRSRIARGSAVRIDLPMSGAGVQGTVASVSAAAAGAGALFPVIVAVDDDADIVLPGMAAEVILSLSMKNELTVPLAAVLDSGSSTPSVFVVDGDVARRVAVRPGRVIGERLTVTADALEAGARVAVVGHTALVDGDKVEVR
jgi:RND family efflux transporter MFP subunit